MAATDQHPADQHSPQDGVDPDEEPSAAWGWHGSLPVAGPIAGWFTAFALFMMLIGNREGQESAVVLIGLGTLLVVMLIGHHLKTFRAKRR